MLSATFLSRSRPFVGASGASAGGKHIWVCWELRQEVQTSHWLPPHRPPLRNSRTRQPLDMGLAGVAFDGSPWVTAASSVALGGCSWHNSASPRRRHSAAWCRPTPAARSLQRSLPYPAPPPPPALAVIGTGGFVAAGAALMARRVASGVGGRRRAPLCLRLSSAAADTCSAAKHD